MSYPAKPSTLTARSELPSLDPDIQIERSAGRGGACEILRAMWTPRTGVTRPVGIKYVRREETFEEEALASLYQEADCLTDLDHPKIVRVLANRLDHPVSPYLILEWLPGESLQFLLDRRQRLSLEEFLPLVLQLIDALTYLEQAQVLHLDIKPSNVMVMPDGQIKLIDFGMSEFYTEARSASDAIRRLPCGTAAYMSPEQASQQFLDFRSDQYSLGVLIHRCLAGRLPFDALTDMQMLIAHATQWPRRLRDCHESGLNPWTAGVFDALLAKDPRHRYPSIAELGQILTAFPAGPRRRRVARSGTCPMRVPPTQAIMPPRLPAWLAGIEAA